MRKFEWKNIEDGLYLDLALAIVLTYDWWDSQPDRHPASDSIFVIPLEYRQVNRDLKKAWQTLTGLPGHLFPYSKSICACLWKAYQKNERRANERRRELMKRSMGIGNGLALRAKQLHDRVPMRGEKRKLQSLGIE